MWWQVGERGQKERKKLLIIFPIAILHIICDWSMRVLQEAPRKPPGSHPDFFMIRSLQKTLIFVGSPPAFLQNSQNERKIYKLRQLSLLSQFVYIFWGKCVYFSIFEWWKCQMNVIVNFIIQNLKSKHTALKKYTNWDKLSCLSLYIFSLVLREREETKT